MGGGRGAGGHRQVVVRSSSTAMRYDAVLGCTPDLMPQSSCEQTQYRAREKNRCPGYSVGDRFLQVGMIPLIIPRASSKQRLEARHGAEKQVEFGQLEFRALCWFRSRLLMGAGGGAHHSKAQLRREQCKSKPEQNISITRKR